MAPITRGNSLYTIVDGPSWTQAEANSVKLGGHLIAITSESEYNFIGNIFSDYRYKSPGTLPSDFPNALKLWIGLYDAGSPAGTTGRARNWRWSSGENYSYVAPASETLTSNTGERYVQSNFNIPSWVTGGIATKGFWQDYPNTDADVKQGIAEIPFVQRGDSAYVVVEGPTWEEAEANAVKLGGHLVTINDAAENSWIYSTFGTGKWIGLTDKDSEGTFRWSSGERVSYTNWAPGEPSNRGNIQDYVWIQYAPGLWDDLQNDPGVNKGIAEIKLTTAPPTPTYSLSTSTSALNEGSTLTTTVSTTNVSAGTTLYYLLSGTGITSADFSAGSLTGSGVVASNGSFSFSHTLANDLTTEGTESLEIKLFSDSNRSTQVGSTATVSIRDTSTTPVPTYSLSTSTNALGEGESFTTTVSTTNVAAGTSLFYALSGNGITATDFTAGGLSGAGTVGSDGRFTFSKTLANDLTTEGTETLTVRLYSDSNLTQQVGNAPSVTVYDTSTTPASTININGNNNGIANTGTINNSGSINTGTINTNSGNTTNITNNNIDKSKTVTIASTTINNITNNITNNISVNAVITNTSAPTYNVSNTYAKNLVGDVLTGSPQLTQNSYDAKFYNLGGGRYGIQQKGKSTIDEITGATSLQFQDQAISLASDVAATFNQVKGIDDVSGVVFRLYNAAFARLPDANGLENWINGNKSGGQTYASSALEFSKSQEFKNRYGSNVTDTQYVTTLYNNVLGRTPDASGLAHYQGLLASGKDRGSLLLDFSESPENRNLFTKVTGLS